jgi:hypothetical protein
MLLPFKAGHPTYTDGDVQYLEKNGVHNIFQTLVLLTISSFITEKTNDEKPNQQKIISLKVVHDLFSFLYFVKRKHHTVQYFTS